MAKLGIGIVGTGWVSDEHIKAYMSNPHCEIVAVCSRKEASAKAKVKAHGLDAEIYTDYSKMLKQSNLDAISICTPNHLHAEETIQAAEAGKHVLIEKPVALNLDDLKKMRDAVRKAKVKTVVGFVLRWNPLYETIKSLIADDAIGDIFYAEVDYLHGIEDWYAGYEWLRKTSTGGSSFLSAGCHAVDGLRWFVQEEAIEVSAYSTKANQNYEYDPTSVAIIKFRNGSVGKVTSCIECRMPYVFNIELLGTKGTIRNNQLYSHKLPGQTDFATIPTILPDSGDVSHHPFQGEMNHMIDCIINNRESYVNLEDAVKTHEICIAADISAAEGRPVKLPLIKD